MVQKPREVVVAASNYNNPLFRLNSPMILAKSRTFLKSPELVPIKQEIETTCALTPRLKITRFLFMKKLKN
jgi:hypothetical protein